MPHRRTVALIAAFWLATVGFAAYRDVWPRLFAGGPPPIAIDLADEASQALEVRWAVTRGGATIGRLTTRMKYLEADDSFRFTHTFRGITIPVSGVSISLPELTTTTRVSRSGRLREQGMEGRLSALGIDGTARMRAEVKDGVLGGEFEISSPLINLKGPLEPVPVPDGQVLNPLQPVNRLANVRPGLRWVVPEVNPVRDSAAAMLKKMGVTLPEEKAGDLLAEVLPAPQTLNWKGTPTACWVIEYRADEPRARTWVRAEDGKVLRQEAFQKGEELALVREH